jgi:Spy/CpxP family protein refolding chaperone
MIHIKSISTVVALVIFAAVSSAAQTPAVEQPIPPTQQKSFGRDPVRELNLSPEQREQIRGIREQNRNERTAVNQRVRETHKALQEALDADALDQALIEQRIQEVSAAQAAAMRMRIMTEVKIRQVLTNEQRIRLKELRHNVHVLRERRINNPERQQRRIEERNRRLERRNRVRPIVRGKEDQQPQ